MAGIKELSQVWDNIQEFDLRPIRESALLSVRIAIVGEPGSGRHHLAECLRRDLDLLDEVSQTPLTILSFEACSSLPDVDLLLVTIAADAESLLPVEELIRRASSSGMPVVVFCDLPDDTSLEKVLIPVESPIHKLLLAGSLGDSQFLRKELVPHILAQLPTERHLALGRHFPLFRTQIARELIDDTCLANATYSFSTGLAEALPVFTIPLSVTDMIVLTKSQAFLAYKLGLLLGFTTRWQDYVTEFGSVIGGGFVLRQIARSLVGLIPGWGIAPKVVVAYSGTYVVGQTILQWYLAGRRIEKDKIKGLYQQAVLRGKLTAYRLFERLPHRKRQNQPELPQDSTSDSIDEYQDENQIEIIDARPKKKGHKLGWPRRKVICPQCGKNNPRQASYCQHCGEALNSSDYNSA